MIWWRHFAILFFSYKFSFRTNFSTIFYVFFFISWFRLKNFRIWFQFSSYIINKNASQNTEYVKQNRMYKLCQIIDYMPPTKLNYSARTQISFTVSLYRSGTFSHNCTFVLNGVLFLERKNQQQATTNRIFSSIRQIQMRMRMQMLSLSFISIWTMAIKKRQI